MAYSLSTHYAGQGLLNSFSFFTGEEPNRGFVDYKGREEAIASNLVSIDEFNRVKLGVDSINTYSTGDKGRPSVRITSDDAFTHGLFIADFAHMPIWAFNNEKNGSLWPVGGEIDIIEGANTAERNLFSAHTLHWNPRGDQLLIKSPVSDSTTYGDAFNAVGGGVYAMEWNSQDIKIWHFPRTAIPYDISRAPITIPDPTSWGPPQALFGGSSCDADSYFFNMSLVINTNFCGAYAGNIWGVADRCNELAPTCEEYVARNPSSFINAFWEINYIDVYQKPVPINSNSTLPPLFPNSTTISTPVISATTSPSLSPNGTGTITRTRTVTVTTVTQTIATTEPTQTGSAPANPATIDGWSLLGCFKTFAGSRPFSQVASSPTTDNKACVASCAGKKYAGVCGETCYCADTLGNSSAVPKEMCDGACSKKKKTPFAGLAGMARTNSTNFHNMTLSDISKSNFRVDPLLPRADDPPEIFLTVYGNMNMNNDVPPAAPGMGGSPSRGEVRGQAVTVTSAVTVTYTTICPTDAGKLMTLEYYTTLTTQQPCRLCSAKTPAVPMTTCTETCNACGPHGESTVTLTVPAAVAAETGGGRVMAITVQTVIPVLSSNTSRPSTNASYANPGISNDIPAVGAGTATTLGRTTAGFLVTLGYGLVLWFTVFWVGIIL
ncbi:hypothetical protein FHL15_005982 [Xylaria flabelliformis]|uniref:GH16 domain-containing protein n=1 Tax=Xylaria flabelliformis TaxID=2512241 RepID=A0A553HYV4_9PEZI|nr:hypothetical protein FHL15_005982 [Xylaria flabelliformis]